MMHDYLAEPREKATLYIDKQAFYAVREEDGMWVVRDMYGRIVLHVDSLETAKAVLRELYPGHDLAQM